MDPWIIGLVAASAVLHLAWNVRLKTAGDPLRTATVGMLAASVAIVPLGIAVWWVGGRTPLPVEVVLGIASGFVEAAYFILLAAAYRRGDLSVVYPIARGTAPLLAVAFGVIVLGERLGVGGSVGVVMLLVGFLWLQRPWRAIAAARAAGAAGRAAGGGAGSGVRAAADSAILFALATGVTIATYTAIDRVGTRQIDPFPYAAILWVTCSVVLVVWVRFVAGGDLLRYGSEAARRAAVGGYLTLGAYLCILVALSVAPVSGVAPLRESATVFAAAWGSVRMGEASDRSGPPTDRRVGADRGRGVVAGGGSWGSGRAGPPQPARPPPQPALPACILTHRVPTSARSAVGRFQTELTAVGRSFHPDSDGPDAYPGVSADREPRHPYPTGAAAPPPPTGAPYASHPSDLTSARSAKARFRQNAGSATLVDRDSDGSDAYPVSGLWVSHRAATALDRLDRWHPTEQPALAEPAVDQPDPGDDEGRPEDDPGVDRLGQDEVAQHDPDDRDDVRDRRGARRAPRREEPEDGEIREPEPRIPSHRIEKIACRSGRAVQGCSKRSASTPVMIAANVTWKTAGIIGARPRTLRRA